MTTLTEADGLVESKILRSDVLGRVRTPVERKEALVAEYKRSGMSAAAFARWSGVKYPTFAAWVAKARKREEDSVKIEAGGEPATKPMSWAEVVCRVPEQSGSSALVIHLGAAVRVEARDGRVAAELLTALGVRAC